MAEVGHHQAQRLARYLASLPVEVLLASTSTRARQTAEYCARLSGLVVRTDDRFCERNFGHYEGLDRTSLLRARAQAGLGSADPTQDWEGESGVESDEAVATRVLSAIAEAGATEYLAASERHVVVFTHAGVVKSVLHHVGFASRARHRTVKLAEGGIVRLLQEAPDTLALHGLIQNVDMVVMDERDPAPDGR
jgi:broad specificity phosphatase PhoE